MVKPLSSGLFWVVAQMILFVLLALVPLTPISWPWGASWSGLFLVAGALLVGAGGALAFAAVFTLGRNLDPLPRPKPDSELVTAGPYAVIRHPIYTSLLLVGTGWGFLWCSVSVTLLVALLVVVFTFKSRLEERWLLARYPTYQDYRSRTGALLPRWKRPPVNPSS